MVRSLSISLVLLLTVASLAEAQPAATPPRIDRITIVDRGIYQAEITKKADDPNLVSGARMEVRNFQLVQETTTIHAANGVWFGFRYTITGEPLAEKVPLKIVLLYPERGITNPRTGKTTFREEFSEQRAIGGKPAFWGRKLGAEWGWVEGVWTYQIWFQDRMYAEQKFTLVRP